MRKLIYIILSTFLFNMSYAKDFLQRMEETYVRQHTHQEIFCTAPNLKLIKTVRFIPNEITSIHKLDEHIVSISLDSNLNFELKTDTGVQIQGKKASRNQFDFIEPEKGNYSLLFYQKYKLNNWLCRAGTYFDKPIVIDERKTHIVVHPHPHYDEQNLASPYIEKKLQNILYRHILLLDNFSNNVSADISDFINGLGVNYRRLEQFTAPSIDIPTDVELFGASAGWSHFKVESKNVNITYTGGNINYCMHNSTNFLIDAFLQYNNDGGELLLNYDLNGIVAQKDGLIGPDFIGGSFFQRQYRGFFVKDYFAQNPDDEKDFHAEWFKFLIEKKFAYRKYFFKNIDLTYKYKNNIYQKTLLGSGEGNYEISLNFIENSI